MSSRGRGRGRPYMGRGSSSSSYRHREDHHPSSHREEHHSSSYRGSLTPYRDSSSGRASGGGEYARYKEMPPPQREHHREERYHGSGGRDRDSYEPSSYHSRSSSPPHHRRPSPAIAPRRPVGPDQILSKLAPDEQVALTQALVATVLRGSNGCEGGRGYWDDRGGPIDRERGFRDDDHDYHERRPPPFSGASSRYHSRGGYREDRGGRGFYRGRGSSFRGSPHERLSIPYIGETRRRYPDRDDPEPPYIRQRLGTGDSKSPSGNKLEAQVRRESRDKDTDGDQGSSPSNKESKKTSDDADENVAEGDSDCKSKHAKVTIDRVSSRTDENSSGSTYKRSSSMFVELQCPHCPSQCSITFQNYKYHLSSTLHYNNMDRLARKHAHMMLCLRKQQRSEQNEIEDEYLEKHPDHAEISISRFCLSCKLNYRCLGGDVKEGVLDHNKSKLHRMQFNYLHPKCKSCTRDPGLPSRFRGRMVYEHHIASITHMKNKMEQSEKFPDNIYDDLDPEDMNLDGFMMVDSVGEDTEEAESEHEDIAFGANAKEFARKAAQADSEDLDHDYEGLEENEPVGMSYVQPVKVYFCLLCYLNIKEGTIRHHCTTPTHRSKFHKAKLAEKEKKESADKNTSEFPRSGGRTGEKDDEPDDDEEAGAENKVNGDRGEDAANSDRKNSEKDYEEYNEKYDTYNDVLEVECGEELDDQLHEEEQQMLDEIDEAERPTKAKEEKEVGKAASPTPAENGNEQVKKDTKDKQEEMEEGEEVVGEEEDKEDKGEEAEDVEYEMMDENAHQSCTPSPPLSFPVATPPRDPSDAT